MNDKNKLEFAIGTLAFILIGNTILFHLTEGWRWVDSFYFSGVTMLTIGYGDFVPTHDITKIIVVFDAMASIGIFLYCLSILTELRIKRLEQWNIRKLREDLPKHISKAKSHLRNAFPVEKPSFTKRRMNDILKR